MGGEKWHERERGHSLLTVGDFDQHFLDGLPATYAILLVVKPLAPRRGILGSLILFGLVALEYFLALCECVSAQLHSRLDLEERHTPPASISHEEGYGWLSGGGSHREGGDMYLSS